MQPLVIYCYDAWCGWCYGFSPVMKQVYERFKREADFEVLSGNMIPKENAAPVERIAGVVLGNYQRVEELTGVQFGEDFLWHMRNPEMSDWFPASEKAAIALSVFKSFYPEEAVLFAADLQYALNYEGRDLNDDEAYRHLLERYSLPAEEFYSRLHSEKYAEDARYDFALCSQLKVSGFPAVFVQVSDTKFYQVAQGYTPFAQVEERIAEVLNLDN